MSIISRRQRELLLNDVSRMINNNIHSAFANHAKVAESISNGDLKLYIDSPKKELVLKYGNNNIRFTISEQTINEIASIVFKDKSIIKGISDSLLKSSSNIALSTKGANELKQQIDNKADKDHDHDDKYADKNHNHDTKYADINHTHNGFQPKGNYATANHNHDTVYAPLKHEHTEYQAKGDYAPATHTHPEYQAKGNYAPAVHAHPDYQPKGSYADKYHTHNDLQPKGDYANRVHTHWDLPNDREDFEEEIKTIVNGPKAWRIIKGILKGLSIASDVGQYFLIAGMQAQIAAIYGCLGANGLIDGVQSASTLGTMAMGFTSKFQQVKDFGTKVVDGVKNLTNTGHKVGEAMGKASDTLGKYTKIADDIQKVTKQTDIESLLLDGTDNVDLATSKLPKATKVIRKGGYTAVPGSDIAM